MSTRRISALNHTYAPSSYDDYFCLKPPLMLWLAVLYLSRAITLPIMMGMGSYFGVNRDALKMFRALWTVQTLVPSMLAAIVLFALLRRAPGASKAVRWIWARGRLLVAIAAGLDLALTVVPLIRAGEINDAAVLSAIAGVIDLFFLAYVLFARRIRDTFSDFPPALDSPGK